MKNLKMLICFCTILLMISCANQGDSSLIYPSNEFENSNSLLDTDVFEYDPNESVPLLSEVGIKYLHDYYASALCYYLTELKGATNELVISTIWTELLVKKTAISMEISEDEVLDFYLSMGVNADNYIHFGLEQSNELPIKYLEFYESIETAYENSNSVDDFLIELNTIKDNASQNLNTDIVESTVEVARSSIPYWEGNIGCITGFRDQAQTRVSCEQAVAFADVWGTVAGAVTGGLLGAMIGAEVGTLGAGVAGAIFGC